MRKLLILFLCAFSISAHAEIIRCYSSGVMIYQGTPNNVYLSSNFLLAEYPKHRDVIFTSDCIVREFKKIEKIKKKK